MTFVTENNLDAALTRFQEESKENNVASQNSENSGFSAQLLGKAKDFQVLSDVNFPCIPSAEHPTDGVLTPLRRATFIKSRSVGPGLSPQKETSFNVAQRDRERISSKSQLSPLREKNYGTGSVRAAVDQLHSFPSSVLDDGSMADFQTLTPSRRTTFVKHQANLQPTPATENISFTASKSVSPPISMKGPLWLSRTVDDMSVAFVPNTPSGLLRSGTYTKLNSSLSPLRSYVQGSTSPTIDEEDRPEGSAKGLSEAVERRKGLFRDVTSSNDVLKERLMMLESKCTGDAAQFECQYEDGPSEMEYETARNTPVETPVDSDHEESFQDSVVCLSHNESGMLSCSTVPCKDIHCCWNKQDQTFDQHCGGKEVIVMETVDEFSFVQEAHVFETRVSIEEVEEVLVEETGYDVGDNSKLEYREVELVDRKLTRQTKSVRESTVLSRDFAYSDVKCGENIDENIFCGCESKTERMMNEVKSTVLLSMSEVGFHGSSQGAVDPADVRCLSPEYKCTSLKPDLNNELNVQMLAVSGSFGRLSSTPARKYYSLLASGSLETDLENTDMEAPSPIGKQQSEIDTTFQSCCLKNVFVERPGDTYIVDDSQTPYAQVSKTSALAEMKNDLPSLIGITVTKTKPGFTRMENVKGRHGVNANRALFECTNSVQCGQAVAKNNSEETKNKWQAEVHPLEEDAATDMDDGHSRQISNSTMTRKYPDLPATIHDGKNKGYSCQRSQSYSILCSPSSRQMPSALKGEAVSKLNGKSALEVQYQKRRHVEGDASPKKKRVNSDGGRPAPPGSGRLAFQSQTPAKGFSAGNSQIFQKAKSGRETDSGNGPAFHGW